MIASKGTYRKYEYGLLAKDYALAKFSSDESLDARRKKIAHRMGLMHGLPQKIGQIVGFGDEGGAFESLTEGAADLSLAAFKELLSKRLGQNKVDRLSWIRQEGISASLGQTHEARLQDGSRVAIKQQYPGIRDAVNHDLTSFGWLLEPIGKLGKSFDMQALKLEIGEMISAELDYKLEASWLRRFNSWLSSDRIVDTPVPIEDMCGDEVLTMSWVEGGNHNPVGEWPLNARLSICERLLSFFLRSTCIWGSVHADPHPGNFRFAREGTGGRVGLVDFGSVKSLSVRFAMGYRKLIESALEGGLSDGEIVERYEDLGFDMDMLEPLRDRLAPLTRIMLKPFCSNERFDMSSWNLATQLKETLGDQSMQFRAAAPANLIFWIRAFHGTARYLTRFKADICWSDLAREVLRSAPSFETGDREEIESSMALIDDPLAAQVALKIEVTRNGKRTVSLSLPGRSLRNLEDLIPEEAKKTLDGGEVSLLRIKQQAIANGYQPGSLFCCEESVKCIRVWLEKSDSGR